MITCGAGAGLAAAFNAPIAGVVFALEEIQKNFEVELSKWTLADVYENSLEELRKEKQNE